MHDDDDETCDYESFICDDCANRLDEYGFICCDLVDTICGHTFHGFAPLYHDVASHYAFKKPIAFLETKGYLLTTDIFDDFIAVLPTNFSVEIYAEEEIFCWCESDL